MIKKKHFSFEKFTGKFDKSNGNELAILDSKNIKILNGKIYSWNKFSNVIKYLFSNEDSDLIITKNKDVLDKTIGFYPYIYFDELIKENKLRLFLLTKNFELFELENESKTFTIKHTFLDKNINVFYIKNSLYFLHEKGECLIAKYDEEIVSKFMPKFDKIFIKNNMIFFNTLDNPFRVYFAEENDIENISIDLSKYDYFDINLECGNLLHITQILNKIFLVCSYKILVIDSEEKTVSISQNLSFKIEKNTIQNYEDYIVFFANDSIYSFDGNNIKILMSNLKFNLLNNANSFTFNDNYYIFEANNSGFIYEINLTDFTLNKLFILNLANIQVIRTLLFNNLFISFIDEDNNYNNITINNEDSRVLETYILFEKINFDSISKKQICDIQINAQGCYDFIIKSNLSNYSFVGENNIIKSNINLPGNTFQFIIKTKGEFSLKNIVLNVMFLED